MIDRFLHAFSGLPEWPLIVMGAFILVLLIVGIVNAWVWRR